MKSYIQFPVIFFFILGATYSFGQNSENKKGKIEYAFLRVDASLLAHKMVVYYSDGTSEDLKKILKMDVTYDPSEDNYSAISDAFLYLNAKQYTFISSAMSDNQGLHQREYIFKRDK